MTNQKAQKIDTNSTTCQDILTYITIQVIS